MALSVQQPWASMIASGQKTIETRTWRTSLRGDLLICSSKSPKIDPAGFALAVVRLVDCRAMTEDDEWEARCEFYSGAFAWVLDDLRRIEPFPVKGRLGLFSVECDPRPASQRIEGCID